MVGQTISHYRILREIGEGGMGVVYLAEDTLLKRRVAIKMLNSSHSANEHQHSSRLLREARAVSQLSHSHIATIHDFGETFDGHQFIVMEFVDGETLGDLIQKKSLTISRTIEIISQVAEALSEAHQHGIIHRDIKPSNIAINRRGEVKVLDFGLAKQIEADTLQKDSPTLLESTMATKTREGVVLGTPLYLSPEQALAQPVDERSDIFSLGSVLYECLTYKRPFFASSVIEICAKILKDDPPLPSAHNPKISSRLDNATLKAMAKEPKERYQTAEEFLEELRQCQYTMEEERTIHTNSIVPETKSFTQRIRTGLYDVFSQRRSLAFAFLGALVIGLLLVGVWFLRSSSPQPASEAQRLYDEGLAHFHNGAFHQAKQSFIKATEADNKFALASARLAETYAEMDYEDKAQNEMLRAMNLITGEHTALSSLDSTAVQASNAIISRDLPTAIEKYKTLAEKTPDVKKVYAVLDLARAYEKNEMPDEAIKTYQEALNISQNNATALLRLGIAYLRQSKDKEANEHFTKAEVTFRAAYNNEGVIEAMYHKGLLSLYAGNLHQARNSLQSTLDIARNNNFRYQQVKTMLQLGGVYFTENKTELSKQYITDAIGMAQADEMESIAADGLIDYGYVFVISGKYDEGINQFKQALELANKVKAKRTEARASLSIGSLLQQQNKYEEASSYIEKALSFYEPKKYRRQTAQALQLNGRILYGKGDYNNAKSSFEKLLITANELSNTALIAAAHSDFATALSFQEKYDEALLHIDESLKINSTLGDTYHLGYDLMIKGNIIWQLGRYNEVPFLLEEAIATMPKNDEINKELLARIHLVKARLALSQRNFPEAKKQSEQVITIAKSKYRLDTAFAKLTLGLAQTFSGDNRAGIKNCQEALDLATLSNDMRLISYAKLALAESQLEVGDTTNAIANVLQSYERFINAGQQDSEWRSLVVLARAYRRANNNENAKKYETLANESLNKLRQAWSAPESEQYFKRSDVQNYINQLSEISR